MAWGYHTLVVESVSVPGNVATRLRTVGPPRTGKARKVRDPKSHRTVPDPRVPEKETKKANRRRVGTKERESRGETLALGDTRKNMSTPTGNSQQVDGRNHHGMMTGMGTLPGDLANGQEKEKGRRPRVRAKAKGKVGAGSRRSRRTRRTRARRTRNPRKKLGKSVR